MNPAELWELLAKNGVKPDSATAIVRGHAQQSDADLWERLVSNGAPENIATQFVKARTTAAPAPTVSANDEEDVSLRDYARAAASGLTFGLNDEIAGLGAAIMPGGKGYTEARDEVRANEAAAKAKAPKRMLAAEMAGGLLPALVTGGAGLASEVGTAARALRAAKIAGGFGALAGFGHSTATTAKGMAKDVATTGAVSALAGGALSGVASTAGHFMGHLADVAMPARAVAREAATQLPDDAAATIARQEALAPGTAVVGDLNPEIAAISRGVGADAKAGIAARKMTEARVQQLAVAKRSLGVRYDALDRPLTVDGNLRTILSKVNESPQGQDIQFSALQKIRTGILEDLRTTRRGSVKQELGDVAKQLTGWMQNQVPEVQQIDADYAFLTARHKAAQGALKEVTNSSKNYAATRAYGGTAGSVGGSLPHGSKGFAEMVTDILKPDRAASARAVQNTLLSPQSTPVSLAQLLKMRQSLNAGPGLASTLGQAGLFGSAIPNGAQGLADLIKR